MNAKAAQVMASGKIEIVPIDGPVGAEIKGVQACRFPGALTTRWLNGADW